MSKEKNEFEEYGSGFFYQRFNRLLGLIRRHRVLPIRPGWEQTPDGIVPPPIYSSEASAIKRPFQVSKTGDLSVSVNTGLFSLMGAGPWRDPSWASGGFNTPVTIAETSYLYLNVTLQQSRSNPALLPVVTGSSIGWFTAAAPPSQSASSIEYIVDFLVEDITEVFVPTSEYTASILIADATVDGGVVTEIGQYVDYNVLIPGNLNRFYEVTSS